MKSLVIFIVTVALSTGLVGFIKADRPEDKKASNVLLIITLVLTLLVMALAILNSI